MFCVIFQAELGQDSGKETSVSSVSVPNLSSDPNPDRSGPNLSSSSNSDTSAVSLLETFAAVARRRASGATSHGATSTNANNSRNTANSLNSGIFGRGLTTNSVSSLVRLALSSNFPSGLLNQVNQVEQSKLPGNLLSPSASVKTVDISGPVIPQPQPGAEQRAAPAD